MRSFRRGAFLRHELNVTGVGLDERCGEDALCCHKGGEEGAEGVGGAHLDGWG